MRTKILGFALLAAAAASPAVAAQSVTITSAGIYNPGILTATVGDSSTNQFAVPLTFTGTTNGKANDFLGFCVDLPHVIYVAIGSQLKETLNYHLASLTSDGYGKPLGTDQVREITGLAGLGFGIAKGSAGDKSAQLAAVQQAIWTVEYPKSTFVATGPYAAAQTGYAATFVKEASSLKGFARTIVANDGNSQAQITNIGGVPEPTMWAEMLAGFGVVGLLSRRRGTTTVVAA